MKPTIRESRVETHNRRVISLTALGTDRWDIAPAKFILIRYVLKC
jgi:hypothetical protein